MRPRRSGSRFLPLELNDDPLRLTGVSEVIHVLVVDDDESDVLLVQETLEDATRREFNVTVASSYEDAVRVIGLGEHDVVLLDHELGARTGVDLLNEIQGKSHLPPVIMLTGADPETTDREALSAGASDLVTKKESCNCTITTIHAVGFTFKHVGHIDLVNCIPSHVHHVLDQITSP